MHPGESAATGRRQLRPALQLIALAVALPMLLSGCAARELIERQSTTLAKANLGPDSRYAVALELVEPRPKSMHQGLIAPLAEQAADMVRAELGVDAVALDHGDTGDWTVAQRNIASAPAIETRKFFKLDRVSPYSTYMRERGFAGFALLTLDETTDGFSRNDLDYSMRGTLALWALGRDEDGDTQKLLARVAIAPTICSRRLNKPPRPGQHMTAKEGYYLTNPQRCQELIASKVREQLQALSR